MGWKKKSKRKEEKGRKKEKGNKWKETFSAKNDVIKTICLDFQKKKSFNNERKFLIKWKEIFLKVRDNFQFVSKKIFPEDKRLFSVISIEYFLWKS